MELTKDRKAREREKIANIGIGRVWHYLKKKQDIVRI
jgi:hypothetical protein